MLALSNSNGNSHDISWTFYLSEIRWRDSEEYPSPSCDMNHNLLWYSEKPTGSRRVSGAGLLLMATAECSLLTWELVLDRILIARSRSSLTGNPVIHYYAPKELSNIVEKDAYREQVHTVQEALPKGGIVIVVKQRVYHKNCWVRHRTSNPIDHL